MYLVLGYTYCMDVMCEMSIALSSRSDLPSLSMSMEEKSLTTSLLFCASESFPAFFCAPDANSLVIRDSSTFFSWYFRNAQSTNFA